MKKTRRFTKRLVALLLTAALLAGVLPLSVQAAEGDRQVYVYVKDHVLETVSDDFWSWEAFTLEFTGTIDYRRVETPAYSWNTTLTVTVDHDNGFARLDFDRNYTKNLPTPSEFSQGLAAYGAERGSIGPVHQRANTQYVWGRTYQYYRAREYAASTPASATLYAKLVTENGVTYLCEPLIWADDPFRSFRLSLEPVIERDLFGPPTGGLDPDKARAYASDPASPPELVFDKKVVVDDVLEEYIGLIVGCTAQDEGAVNGKQVAGLINSDNRFSLVESLGGSEEKFISSAVSQPLNAKNSRTAKTLDAASYESLFPASVRDQLNGSQGEQGEIGLCKDVTYDHSKGSAIINSGGTISIYPNEGYQVDVITVNGREIEFTTDISGWTIISGIRTTDKVVITFKELEEGPVGKCEDVRYDESKGFAVVGDDGTVSICPTSPNKVLEVTVNGQSVPFTSNYGWVVLENIRTTDVVTITFGVPGSGFTDLASGAYYCEAVDWAVRKGITKGVSSTRFDPEGDLTRGQVVTFLWRLAGSPEPTTASQFIDVNKGDYFYKAVIWASDKGITKGTSAHKFSPNDLCTRGQVVTFLWRYFGKPNYGYSTFYDVSSGSYCSQAVAWAARTGITKGTSAYRFSPDKTCTRGQGVTFLHRADQQGGNPIGGNTPADNDKTGFVPKSWSWTRDGTEGYGLPYFTSGKYVRRDGKAVLYIESSSGGGDFFHFQLYAMADNGKDAWYRPDEWYGYDYVFVDCFGSTAYSDMEYFTDNGSHVITLRTDYEDHMPLYYSMPDGEYVLVREK